MSQLAVERVLGRLITDAEFRAEFLVEPGGVCQDHGFDLTPVELTALLRVDEQALCTLMARLDPKIVRAKTFRDEAEAPRGPSRIVRDRRPQRDAK